MCVCDQCERMANIKAQGMLGQRACKDLCVSMSVAYLALALHGSTVLHSNFVSD